MEKLIMVADTETTGITNTDVIIQMSFVMYNMDSKMVVKEYNEYIKITRDVPPFITNLTGITKDKLNTVGIPISKCLETFVDYYNSCDLIVGHNIKFDLTKINEELIRLKNPPLGTKKTYDTMLIGTNIAKIPKNNYKNQYKWPKLEELYRHLFNKEPIGLHDSANDIKFTLECYLKMAHNL
jgi:DNA polymerase III alpha subunit (gram-positive type)